MFVWANLCPQLISRKPINFVLSLSQKNPVSVFVLPVPLGKETKGQTHTGRLKDLDEGCCSAGFTLGFIAAVLAITCRQINLHTAADFPCGLVFKGRQAAWGG